ncbi:uncharacterized protein LOC134811488 [Bolinopsis microptera]|uniref:uncharacterized protein LOC134811488 n=1 Tax=Bolinopsis microptera TaxID=2820187 RepID=UPI00307945CB
MICSLLLLYALFLRVTPRKRKEETSTLEIIEGPLHAITSNPTTSFDTYSKTISFPTTKSPTTSHYNHDTAYNYSTVQPVTNKVFTAENVVPPERTKTNLTFMFSSMSPLPSPSSSTPTLTQLPNQPTGHVTTAHVTTDHVTTDHVTTDHVTTDHVTTDHVTTYHVTTDHVTTDHVTTDHVTTDHVTTGQNVTKQSENGTKDNKETMVCDECALARALGYLISCLVVAGVLSNLFCYLHFLRRVNGVTGLMYSVFTLSDVVMLLCLVPVATSYILYQGAAKLSLPLRYSKGWLYAWNFSLRFNIYLLSLLSLRGATESHLKPAPCKVAVGLIVGGGVTLLLLTLIPLFLTPHYVVDSAFLMYDVEMSVGLAVVYDTVLGVLILVTFGGVIAGALPSKKKYALVTMVTQGVDEGSKVVKKRKEHNKDVSSHRFYTIIFCITNMVFKAPLLFLHSLGRYGSRITLSPLFSVVLVALVLCAALMDSLMYLIASICKQSAKSEHTTENLQSRENSV